MYSYTCVVWWGCVLCLLTLRGVEEAYADVCSAYGVRMSVPVTPTGWGCGLWLLRGVC